MPAQETQNNVGNSETGTRRHTPDALDRLRDLAYDLYRTHPDPYDAHYQLELIDRDLPKIRAVLDAADVLAKRWITAAVILPPDITEFVSAVRAGLLCPGADEADPHAADDIDLIEPRTIDEARLQMARDLHRALFGDVWARPASPADVWRDLIARVSSIAKACHS